MLTGTNKAANLGGFHRPRSSSNHPTSAHEATKRGFDLCVAALCLIVASAVMVLIALAVWLHDGGPVIFRHRRVGRQGLAFHCLKFRTMVVDADRLLADLEDRNEADGLLFKMRADPRVTRTGRRKRTAGSSSSRGWGMVVLPGPAGACMTTSAGENASAKRQARSR